MRTWRKLVATLICMALGALVWTASGCVPWNFINRRPPTPHETEAYMHEQPEWRRRDWKRNWHRLPARERRYFERKLEWRRNPPDWDALHQAELQLAVEMERHPQ